MRKIGSEVAFEIGLPAAKESEQVIIAQMISGHLEPTIVFAEIAPKQFYTANYRMLAEIIRDLDRDGMSPDMSMVMQVGISTGRSEMVMEAMFGLAEIPSSVKWRQHCAQIRKMFVLRELHEKFNSLSVLALDQTEDADEIFAKAQRLIEGLQGESRPRYEDLEHPRDTARRVGKTLHQWATPPFATPLCPMPFDSVMDTVDGFHEGQLVIVGARPGAGKTALAVRLLEEAAGRQRTRTVFYTLEMTKQSLVSRMVSGITGINSRRARMGDLADHPLSVFQETRYREAFEWVESWPFEVSESRNTRVSDIRVAIRPRIKSGLKVLIVDYLGLLSPEQRGESRNREVSDISRALKNLAMEFKIVVIALHQLSRDNMKQGREPQLEDLRDSGSVEQDADLVLLLHSMDFEPISRVKLIVAKQRDGPTGFHEIEFVRNTARFTDAGGLEKPWQEQKQRIQ